MGITATDAMLGKADALYFSVLMELYLTVTLLWPPDVKSWLIGKDPVAGKDWGQEEKGATEDEMVEWQYWLSGHEFEQTQGDNDRQRSLQFIGSQRVGHNLVTEQQS